MRTGGPSPTTRLLAGVTAAAAAVGLGISALAPAQDVERATFDARMDVRGRRPPPRDIVVVAIDATTFQTLDRTWPFDRRLHAKAIRRIGRDRPAAIGYDVQFAEQTTRAADNALIEALRATPGVVLAASEYAGRDANVLGGPPAQEYARVRVGNAQMPTDDDGVFRRFALEVEHHPTFAAQLLRAAGRTPEVAGARDKTGYIDFAGPDTVIKEVSFSRVVRGTVPRGFFRDKVVIVGPTAPTLQDVHPTSAPGGGVVGGALIQGAAVETMLRGVPLRDVPAPLGALLAVLLGAAGPVLALRARGLWLFLGVLGAGAAYGLVATGSFVWLDAVLPIVGPLTALLVGGTGALAQQLTREALDRTRTRDAFSRFVPAGVVERVLDDARAADGSALRLGGVQQDVTILFSDLRGFTTFSEARDPEEVIGILNHYLTAMTDCILDGGGTLITYMGDGIMAAFGAPVPMDRHADLALATAQAMLARLDRFNAWLAAEHGLPPFRMGIGLNSGPAMSGNVGSDRRLEYTIIGDVVNTAARLEGMTKGTPHDLFVADSTVRRLDDPGTLVHVASLPVRGRSGLIDVWAPQGPAVLEDAARAEAHHGHHGEDEQDERDVEGASAG